MLHQSLIRSSAGHDHDRGRRDDCAARSSIPSAHRGAICESRDAGGGSRRSTGGSRHVRGHPRNDSRCNRDRRGGRFAWRIPWSRPERESHGQQKRTEVSVSTGHRFWLLPVICIRNFVAGEDFRVAWFGLASKRNQPTRTYSSGAGSFGPFSAGARGRRDALLSRSRSSGENWLLKRSDSIIC